MLDLKGATKGLTDKEIRDFVNQTTAKYIESTLKTNEMAKEAEKTKHYNQNLGA